MFLAELFQQSVPFRAIRGNKSSTEYQFELDGTHYEMYVEVATLPQWQWMNLGAEYGQQAAMDIKNQPVMYVEFSTIQGPGGRDRYALTNRGQAPRIFSTVIEIIQDALKRHSVRYIKFDAKEANRQSLYKKIAKRFGKEVYEVERPASSGSGMFGDKVFILKVA